MPDFRAVAQQVEQDEQGRTLVVYHRDGTPYLAADGTKATITVIGSESKRYRKFRDERLQKLAEDADGDEDEKRALARIATAANAVTAWHGWGDNGTEPPCTAEHVSVLLSVEHILTQVEAGIGRRTGFFVDDSSG